MALFGYLSCFIGVYLEKKLFIYTSSIKKKILDAFISTHNINLVTVIAPIEHSTESIEE
jgi:hypothetical protein